MRIRCGCVSWLQWTCIYFYLLGSH